MMVLWACLCDEEWEDEANKNESICPACGLIARLEGGFKCVSCGFQEFYYSVPRDGYVCQHCGKLYRRKDTKKETKHNE